MKLLKYLAVLVGVLVLVFILAIVVLTTFVSPNRFKPLITEQVKKTTGRTLLIDGDLSWSFFPYLGLKVGHLQLNNPAGFSQKVFAEIQSATIGVKLLPLFRAEVESSGITLSGMNLHLIKNAHGKTNWEDLQHPAAAISASPSMPANPAPVATPAKKASFSLLIAGVDVSNANIDWTDETTKQVVNIEQFEFHAKNISLTERFPIAAAFRFRVNNPVVAGKISLKSDVNLALDKEIYGLYGLDLSAVTQQGAKNLALNVKGDMTVDMKQQTLQWTSFSAHLANLTVTGKIGVTNLVKAPRTTGSFAILPFDLKTWLQTTGQDVAALKTAKEVSGNVDFSLVGKALIANSNLKIDNVQLTKLSLSNVHIRAHFQDGMLAIAPLTATLYQGSLETITKIDLNGTVPRIGSQGTLQNIQAELLMKDLLNNTDSKLHLTGQGNVSYEMAMAGINANAIMQSLNGSGRFSFNNGTLEGINIGYMIDSAVALIKRQGLPEENAKKTVFGNLTGTALIRNGVVTNNDLLLKSPRFVTHGKGTIDLVNQLISYRLEVNLDKNADAHAQQKEVSNLYGIAVPISITGSLSAPSIRLDSSAIAKAITEMQMNRLKTKAQEKIQEQIQGQLKGKVPEKAAELLQNFLGR